MNKKLVLLGVVLLAAGALIFTQLLTAQGPGQGQRPEQAQSPQAPGQAAAAQGPPINDDNRANHDREARGQGQIIRLSGPETRGRPIQVGGRQVQLPGNAFVRDFVIAADCDEARFCPDEFPALVIDRGGARAWVGVDSGNVMGFENADGRESEFDFLPGRGQGRGRGNQ